MQALKSQVTINNIASKTSVDKLTDRAVKYDINNGVVDKTKGNIGRCERYYYYKCKRWCCNSYIYRCYQRQPIV